VVTDAGLPKYSLNLFIPDSYSIPYFDIFFNLANPLLPAAIDAAGHQRRRSAFHSVFFQGFFSKFSIIFYDMGLFQNLTLWSSLS
jgi:hypothetical protein